jgi:aryl carrier-like protein
VTVGVDSIHMVKDRDKWRAVVSKVMNLQVVHIAGDPLTS